MLCHHDRRMTKPVARRPLRPTGNDGMGPAAALSLLDRWKASPSSWRLASSPMALVTRPYRLPPRAPRAHSRITSHFGIPASRHLRGTIAPSSAAPQSQILEIAGLFLRSAQSVATESDAKLRANSVKLFLSGPLVTARGGIRAPQFRYCCSRLRRSCGSARVARFPDRIGRADELEIPAALQAVPAVPIAPVPVGGRRTIRPSNNPGLALAARPGRYA